MFLKGHQYEGFEDHLVHISWYILIHIHFNFLKLFASIISLAVILIFFSKHLISKVIFKRGNASKGGWSCSIISTRTMTFQYIQVCWYNLTDPFIEHWLTRNYFPYCMLIYICWWQFMSFVILNLTHVVSSFI